MTVTVERVVLATDGSASAATAAAHAVFLARVLDVPLHVVSATGTPPAPATETAAPSASAAFEAEEAVGAVTRRALLAGVRLTSEVAGGPAATVVERAVGDGDLLVLGRRGRTDSGRFLVGSVAERILDDPPAPTLVVPAGLSQPTYRRIALLASDAPSSEPTATLARRIAAATRGTLEPLAVVDERDAAIASPETRRALEREARTRVKDVVAAAARDAVESGGTVRTGVPTAELLAHVERTGADAVVLGVGGNGRSGRSGGDGGSDGSDENGESGDAPRPSEHRATEVVANRTVRHAAVPTLVVPTPDDAGNDADNGGPYEHR
ncbi:universal stress protein [Haloferax marisrubri]|uniref:Universal stress protein n=1 Tax=Haloferax marisrubri TaxID=1544719 RepID=A0A2P4NTM3_9EURY|nr:universal stress protein [Haloferax marisrubri]POG56428.1 universal stress protein [Haloferax marisrubri]